MSTIRDAMDQHGITQDEPVYAVLASVSDLMEKLSAKIDADVAERSKLVRRMLAVETTTSWPAKIWPVPWPVLVGFAVTALLAGGGGFLVGRGTVSDRAGELASWNDLPAVLTHCRAGEGAMKKDADGRRVCQVALLIDPPR